MDHILCYTIYFLVFISRFAQGLNKLGIGTFERWEPGHKLKILLVGYNGARNTGSDVRVVAIARKIKELFGPDHVQITVMTLDAASLEGYFDEDVSLLTFSTIFPLDLLKACTSHHVAILCEGSTLKSTFANGLTLFLCEAAGIMAAQKKPCIAYGSEVGHMDPFVRRAASRLCRETYFITRTRGSLKALGRLGLKGHAGTDAAWSYDGAISSKEAKRLLMESGWDGNRPLIGIAVINPFCWPVRASLARWVRAAIKGDRSGQYDQWYFYSDSPRRRAVFKRYIKSIADGVNEFMKQYDAFPVIIGMERLDDKACRVLKARLGRPGVLVLSGDHDAAVMTGILRELSFLVTSRYHAALLSMESACPVVAVSMDERLDGIMEDLALDSDYLFHTRDKSLDKKIYKALKKADRNRDSIKGHIQEQVTCYKNVLDDMGSFLKEYINNNIVSQEMC